MKAVHSIVYLLILATHVFASVRVKRGLTKDEQKKFLDVLNEDRLTLFRSLDNVLIFKNLTYDVELEKKAEAEKCVYSEGTGTFNLASLKLNKVFKEMNDHEISEGRQDMVSRKLFNMYDMKIGCSKEKACSHTLQDGKWSGKTIKSWGACAFSPKNDFDYPRSWPFEKYGMPSYEKYGDLLGVVEPPETEQDSSDSSKDSSDSPTGSSGNFFSLTLFLGSIVSFYF